MAERLIFHYHSRDSFLHRLDARVKLLGVFCLTFLIFSVDVPGFFLLLPPVFGSVLLCRMRIRAYSREFRFFLLFSIVIFAGNYWGSGSVQEALLYSVRFLTAVLLSLALTESTDPSDMAQVLFWLLRPFSKRKAAIVAAQLELTVSFIPMIFDAYEQIREARLSRGDQGKNPFARVLSLSGQLIDLLLERTQEISYALESRRFDPESITCSFRATRGDRLTFTVLIIYLAGVLFLSFA